jgi:hypothetical protein
MHHRPFAIITVMVLSCAAGLATTIAVDATADIYSSGHTTLPNTIFPGEFAPSVSFQSAPDQVLTFSSVTGIVSCNSVQTNGPDGTCVAGVSTTVTSYGGLSGISINDENMFLVGVFLGNAEPTDPAPSVLAYNYGTPNGLTTSDASFAPLLDQVFFIGDGLTGTNAGQEQAFYVPAAATSLYLGFADSFDSVPSFYADNVGTLQATFQISNAAPEPSTLCLLGGGLILILFLRGRKRPIAHPGEHSSCRMM